MGHAGVALAGRRITRSLGEVLVSAGVLVLLFVVYQLWWTNVVAQHATATVSRQLEARWGQQPSGVGSQYPGGIHPGSGFALLYLPRLGAHWREPVIQGVTLDDLAKGVGHYPASALPGAVGNFAVAGHRATNGQPFANLDQIRPGDSAVVETATRYYVYRLGPTHIVAPTKTSEVLPVPNHPGGQPHRRLITLTTCNPRWASYQRMIIHGVLVSSTPKAAGRPAALSSNG